MHPMLAPNRKPGVVPHRLLGVILTAFNVFSGLGRFGRVLRAVLHGSGRSGKAIERLLDGLWRGGGRSWRGFGRHVGPKMAAKLIIEKSVSPRCWRFHSCFLVEFKTKISSPGDQKSAFEHRNSIVKCILAFSTQTRNSVRVGSQHGPMWASRIPENLSLEGV